MADQKENDVDRLGSQTTIETESLQHETVASRRVEVASPTAENLYWYKVYRDEPYYNGAFAFQDYAPAYRLGYMHHMKNRQSTWAEAEVLLRSDWPHSKDASRLSWDDARHAVHAAWHHVEIALSAGDKTSMGW